MTRNPELVTAVALTAVTALDDTARTYLDLSCPSRDIAEGVVTGALEAVGKALGGDREAHLEAARLLVAGAMAYTRRGMHGASPEVCVMHVRELLDTVARDFEKGAGR